MLLVLSYNKFLFLITVSKAVQKLDPVGSTVRYEMMKLCTGSAKDSSGWYLVVLRQYKAVPVGQ